MLLPTGVLISFLGASWGIYQVNHDWNTAAQALFTQTNAFTYSSDHNNKILHFNKSDAFQAKFLDLKVD